METEDERRTRLENDAATKRLRLVIETEEERKARLVKMVATTQLRLAMEAEDERSAKKWIGFGFDLDLIGIEIGVLKNFKECARSPCNGNHFSSNLPYLGFGYINCDRQVPRPVPLPTAEDNKRGSAQ